MDWTTAILWGGAVLVVSLIGLAVAEGVRVGAAKREMEERKRVSEKRQVGWSIQNAWAGIQVVADRVERVRELGVDAHKRIGDNRKLNELREAYWDERVSALEARLEKMEAKKCRRR